MKNTRKSSAQLAAKSFMSSLSMNEFFIPGSNGISFLATLKSQFTLAYSICFGPLSFVMRMYDDMRVQAHMKVYRPLSSMRTPPQENAFT